MTIVRESPIVVCPVHGLVHVRRDQDPAFCPHATCRRRLLEFPDQVEAALSMEAAARCSDETDRS